MKALVFTIASFFLYVALFHPVGSKGQDSGVAAHYFLYRGLYEEIGLGDMNEAIRSYNRVAVGESKLAGDALVRKGLCFEKLGDEAKAWDCYRMAIAEFPEKTSILGQESESMRQLSSRSVTSLVSAGLRKAKQGELADARDMFTKALLIDPDNDAARLQLASTCKGLGNYDEAITYYRLVMSSPPHRGDLFIHRQLAECYQKIGQPDEVVKLWQNYCKQEGPSESDEEMAIFELELAYEASDRTQNQNVAQKLKKYLSTGEEQTRNRKFGEAYKTYQASIQDFPKSSLPLYRLAFLQEHFLNKPQLAVQYYQEALAVAAPIMAQRARCRLALLYAEGGDLDVAVSYIGQYFSHYIRPVREDLERKMRRIKVEKEKQDSLKVKQVLREQERQEKMKRWQEWERIQKLKERSKTKEKENTQK